VSPKTTSTHDQPRPERPPGWWESIDRAVAESPEPSAELADRIGALMAPHLRPALSPAEFAAEHGISVPTVFRLIRSGQLESYLIGGQRRIRPDVSYKFSHPH
jgi:excisionase family DNA binding protein